MANPAISSGIGVEKNSEASLVKQHQSSSTSGPSCFKHRYVYAIVKSEPSSSGNIPGDLINTIKTPTNSKYSYGDHPIPKCRSHASGKSRKALSNSLYATPNTPIHSDRFIPPRGSMNFSASYHKIMQTPLEFSDGKDIHVQDKEAQERKSFQKCMSENFSKVLGESNRGSILQYQSKWSSTPKGRRSQTPVKEDSRSLSKTKKNRNISSSAERVLDAPNYIDDYYLNLLDWSSNVNLLSVGLDQSVYVWNPETSEINHLCEFNAAELYVTSLKWIEQGHQLAVGTVNGVVQLWDVVKKKCLRELPGHSSRVGCLAWNSHVLSSGCRGGDIHNHDVRVRQHHVSSFISHTQEVCGMQWSPSKRYLATGSNSNKLIIWDWNNLREGDYNITSYVHKFDEHRAAVKALAWCPWQHHILASGGGAADKTIKFWNVNSGNCLNSISTDSQVSSLLWSNSYKEIISGHGYPNNQLSIWEYPSMNKKIDLLGHTARVLQMVLSPDETHVMSAAGDETLRLWHCFEQSETERMKLRKRKIPGIISLSSIR